MKKAIFTGPGQPLKVIEDQLPDVPPEGALIRTLYSGVCHSDVHLRTDAIDMGAGQTLSFLKLLGDRYLGTTFGHEICGEIVAFGSKADPGLHGLRKRDNVCVYPWLGCETCETCVIGLNNLCDDAKKKGKDIGISPDNNGGYATHVPVPDCRFLIKVPETLPLPIAAMLPCSAATAYASLLKVTSQVQMAIQSRGQANLLVIGAGGLGLWCVQLAKKALFQDSHVNVFVADINQEKIEIGKKAGANEGFIWERDATVEDLVKTTTNDGGQKIDAAFNFVGSSKTSDIALKCLHKGGILVMVGLFGGCMQIQTPSFVLRGLSIAGGKASSLVELKELVQLVSKKGLEYPSLQFIKLEGVNHALDELEAGRMSGRAVIKFD